MKAVVKFMLVVLLLITQNSLAQMAFPDSLLKKKCDIITKSSVIKNAEVWKIENEKVEYLQSNSLHDIALSELSRIEYERYLLVFQNKALIAYQAYDLFANFEKGYVTQVMKGGFYFVKKGTLKIKGYSDKNYYYTKGKIYFSTEHISDKSDLKKENQSSYANNHASAKGSSDTIKHDSLLNVTVSITQNDSLGNLNQPSDTLKNRADTLYPDYAMDRGTTFSTLYNQSNTGKEMLDGEQSFTKGQEQAKRDFNATGYGLLACGVIGCAGIAAPIVLTMDPDPPNYAKVPDNVNRKMYNEGYKSEKIRLRKKPILIGTLAYCGLALGLVILSIVSGL
ncbi:MAG: hypothetical protein ACK5HE_04105 [Bacteroidota bacterium]